jgi:FKBP12-rapamycin complex-associated protein
MNDKYQRIMELLLQLRTHKSDIIRRAIIQLVPKLARYNPDVFATDYLPTWTLHLVSLAVIKKPERSVSLKALGQMATEIGPRVKSQLDKIMNTIIQSFMVKGAPKVPPVLPPEIFECISALAQAIGEEFEPHIAPLLSPYRCKLYHNHCYICVCSQGCFCIFFFFL